MFSVPVIMYRKPIPIRMKVAPMVPITRYWKAAFSARRSLPMLITAYDANDEISRKTNRLKASPVTVMPASPAKTSSMAA